MGKKTLNDLLTDKGYIKVVAKTLWKLPPHFVDWEDLPQKAKKAQYKKAEQFVKDLIGGLLNVQKDKCNKNQE